MPSSSTVERVLAERRALDGTFLYCSGCSAAHRISVADRAPLYAADGAATGEDDLHRYLGAHGAHELSWLRRASDTELRSHARWDPMCQTSWELTDGRRAFVVTFGRPDLDAPRRYSIRQGRLELEHEAAEVDTVILARVIDEALYPHVAPAMRIRALVDTCRTALAAYPPDGFEPVDEDRDDPAVLLACLPASLVVLLEAEVSRHFEGIDVERLCEVLENDLSKDIPVVRLIRRYVVVPADSLS